MKINRSYKRLFTFLLCAAIVLTLMPTAAFAQSGTQASTEVVALREENVKHFDMGDGTYQAIAYSHPVHEKDSQGNWQDIDFSMKRTLTKGIAAYTNAAAGTTFSAAYTANEPLMTLSGEGTSISLTPVQSRKTLLLRNRQKNTSIFSPWI